MAFTPGKSGNKKSLTFRTACQRINSDFNRQGETRRSTGIKIVY